jgi:hypothetical protein
MDILEERYSDLLNRNTGPGKKIIVSYSGEMDQDRVSMLSYAAEHQLDNEGARRGTIKKIFNILIELLQNILIHSASPESGKKFYCILAKNLKDYVVITANIVSNDSAEKIKATLNQIKKMNERQLKNHYLEVLANEQYSIKGGAGLGLITVALKSNNQFTYDCIRIDEHISLFEITTTIPE